MIPAMVSLTLSHTPELISLVSHLSCLANLCSSSKNNHWCQVYAKCPRFRCLASIVTPKTTEKQGLSR